MASQQRQVILKGRVHKKRYKTWSLLPISHLREYAKWNMSYTCHHCQYSVTLLMCRGRCYDLWGYLYPSLGMFISGFLPIMLMPNPSEAFSSLHTHTHNTHIHTSWLNSLIFQFKSLVYPVFTFMLPLSIAGAQLCNNWVWIFKPHRIYNLMRAPVEKTKRPLELCLEIWIIKVGVHNLPSAVKSPSSFKRQDTLLKDCSSSCILIGRRPWDILSPNLFAPKLYWAYASFTQLWRFIITVLESMT